jgi:hypothetical protein
MTERETDLGGAPTEWHDAWELAAQVKTLIQHGNDPTSHLGRLLELGRKLPPGEQHAFAAFDELVNGYLAAVARGSVHCDEWKHKVESFAFPERAP